MALRTAVLIHVEHRIDDLNQYLEVERRTPVQVSEKSVERTEYFMAGRNGLAPSLVLVTNKLNYRGEKTVEYRGRRYGIYRTWCPEKSAVINLYLAEKGNGVTAH